MISRMKKLTALILMLATVVGCVALSGCGVDLEKAQYPQEYSEYVSKYAKEYKVEEAFVYAIIKAESGFDSSCTSQVGAVGLMQLMPETMEWIQAYEGKGADYDVEEFYIPEINIKYGTMILRYLLDMHSDIGTVAAAYNAGWGNVDNWLSDPEYSDDGKTLKAIPFPETEAYVEKVTNNYNKYKELYY